MMTQSYQLRPMEERDAQTVMDIFNHYVENSFAAYPQDRLPHQFFGVMQASFNGFPHAVVTWGDEVVGFGGLRAYNPMPVFKKTAEISYFIKPGHTAKGLGAILLGHLIEGARQMGIESILASISSLNETSLKFHKKHGFAQCGEFKRIGYKNETYFDVVYMQKFI